MRLVFVYNANAGLFSAITDTAHKILSPDTYECRLCYHTYGAFGMLRPWKEFLEQLGVPLAFYHRNEFHTAFRRPDIDLPVILTEQEGALQVLVSAEEIDACADLEELKQKVAAGLEKRGSSPAT